MNSPNAEDTMKSPRFVGLLFALAVLSVCFAPLARSQTRKDSLHAATQTSALGTVLAHQRQYCKTKNAAKYICADSGVTKSLIGGEGALILSTAPIPPTPIPTPTDSLAEPVFDATKATMVYQQNFDAYTIDSLRPPCGATPPRIFDHATPYCNASTSWKYDANVTLVPGRSGQGVSFHYDANYDANGQETHGVFLPSDTARATRGKMTVVQQWVRWTADPGFSFQTKDADGNPSAIAQIKNIMLWHVDGRFQWFTHAHAGGCLVYGPSYTMVGGLESKDTFATCSSDQPIGPFMYTFADGAWHRWTAEYKPSSAPGARDGVARLWIDGTLVANMERGACGVTPPGGWKPWCDLSELDGLDLGTGFGIIGLEWGANRTDGTAMKFSYALDDVRWWKLN